MWLEVKSALASSSAKLAAIILYTFHNLHYLWQKMQAPPQLSNSKVADSPKQLHCE
jgi:hypothetical protein